MLSCACISRVVNYIVHDRSLYLEGGGRNSIVVPEGWWLLLGKNVCTNLLVIPLAASRLPAVFHICLQILANY